MNRNYNNLFRIGFAFSDLFAINLIQLIVLQHLLYVSAVNCYYFTVYCIFNNMAWLISSYSIGVYINNKLQDFKILSKRTLAAFLLFLGMTFIFELFFFDVGRDMSVVYILCDILIFLCCSRVLFIAVVSFIYGQDRYQKKAVFIGNHNLPQDLFNHFHTNKKITVAGAFIDDENDSNAIDFPILGGINDCIQYAKENNVNEIYSTLSPRAYPQLYKIAEEAESLFIRFKFIPDLSDFSSFRCHVDFIDDTPILSLRPEPLESIPGQIKKRVFDIVFSCLVLVFILSWLIPILALIIYVDSPGPVFFTQMRTGKNNRPFTCIKLRTLKINPEADSVQVTRGDSRITKVGGFLRKSNLDELPQFINVLLGNMSIVGARPHMLKHTEEYSKMHHNYMVRHFLKPGVTGWAQINGYRGEIKHYDQLLKRIEYDIWYVENWNIWLDVRIVWRTLYSTLKGDKNAF